jgi:hypothetical protein
VTIMFDGAGKQRLQLCHTPLVRVPLRGRMCLQANPVTPSRNSALSRRLSTALWIVSLLVIGRSVFWR